MPRKNLFKTLSSPPIMERVDTLVYILMHFLIIAQQGQCDNDYPGLQVIRTT